MAWYRRLLNTLRPHRLHSEIDEELRHHIESRIVANLAGGMSPEDARRNALRRFGRPDLVLNATHDADILVWLDSVVQDLRCGIRNMISNPGVAIVALFSLALAIGANTAIFSLVDVVLLRALPYREPSRIAVLWQTNTLNSAIVNVSVPNFESWKMHAQEFEELALYREADASFIVNGEANWIEYAWVHGEFFRLFGRGPALGRVFSEGTNDAHDVVISHRLWTRSIVDI